MDIILFRDFFSSGTEGRGFELWLADSGSLPPGLKALLILTGGAGGLSSSSPLSDMTGVHLEGEGGSERGTETDLQTDKELRLESSIRQPILKPRQGFGIY